MPKMPKVPKLPKINVFCHFRKILNFSNLFKRKFGLKENSPIVSPKLINFIS